MTEWIQVGKQDVVQIIRDARTGIAKHVLTDAERATLIEAARIFNAAAAVHADRMVDPNFKLSRVEQEFDRIHCLRAEACARHLVEIAQSPEHGPVHRPNEST
jgi:hypothetical protein